MLNSESIQFSIVIVNYKSEAYLNQCIASIYAECEGINKEVIISNNDNVESLIKIKKKYPEIEIINNTTNIGFGAASNAGAKQARGKYLFFLNPDTQLVSFKYEQFQKELVQNNETGIWGAQVLTQENRQQKWTVGWREVDLWDLWKNNISFFNQKQSQTTLFWVSGAALIVKKEWFGKINGFDEKFFLYFEDVDLCKRMRKLGKKIGHTKNIQIKHKEGGSQKNKIKQKKEFYLSQDYYFRKHFGLIEMYIVKILRKMFV